jgi:hypothetical protein
MYGFLRTRHQYFPKGDCVSYLENSISRAPNLPWLYTARFGVEELGKQF